jgi:hypothetical protein
MFRSLIRRGPHRLIGLTTLAAVGSVVEMNRLLKPAGAGGASDRTGRLVGWRPTGWDDRG